jgi:predicted nucleic acid-binding protein
LGLLIDASALIAAEREELDLQRLGRGRLTTPVAIAAITASEWLHGGHRADSSARRNRRESFVESVIATLAVFPFDVLAARIHARLWAELASKGLKVGAHDLLVAATAIASGFGVATRDLRSFPRIPGLAVERF